MLTPRERAEFLLENPQEAVLLPPGLEALDVDIDGDPDAYAVILPRSITLVSFRGRGRGRTWSTKAGWETADPDLRRVTLAALEKAIESLDAEPTQPVEEPSPIAEDVEPSVPTVALAAIITALGAALGLWLAS